MAVPRMLPKIMPPFRQNGRATSRADDWRHGQFETNPVPTADSSLADEWYQTGMRGPGSGPERSVTKVEGDPDRRRDYVAGASEGMSLLLPAAESFADGAMRSVSPLTSNTASTGSALWG